MNARFPPMCEFSVKLGVIVHFTCDFIAGLQQVKVNEASCEVHGGSPVTGINWNSLKPASKLVLNMQIGNVLIPFTKPASPVIWVRPYQSLSIVSKGDASVAVRTSAEGFSIGSIGRYIWMALGLSLMIVPLVLGAMNLSSSVVDGDAAENPCDAFPTSEYIEFQDVGLMCLAFEENWNVDSFERAEEHFRFQSEWSGFEEYRWSQSGDVVSICNVDREVDEYYCNNVIRVQEQLNFHNLSYYSIYGGIPQDMPLWINDRPSSLSVDYQPATDAPFGTDRLVMALDDIEGLEFLETRTYGPMTTQQTGYSVPIERGLIEMMFPYVLPVIIGLSIFSFSGARVTVLEFNPRASNIQRRLNIGTPLSQYDWKNVDFQKFTLDEHSFTVTHHSGGDEHTPSTTSYTHHSGLNLSCAHEGGSHVLFFFENKNNNARMDLINDLFKALGVENPLHASGASFVQKEQQPSQTVVHTPPVSQAPVDQSNATLSPDSDAAEVEVQESSSFWDNV